MRSRVCIAAVLLLALAGCSNGDPAADPSDSATSSAASETSGSDSATDTTDAPDVEPADGPTVKGQFLTYRLPGGRKWDRFAGQAYWFDPRTGGDWVIWRDEFEENVPHTVDQMAETSLDVAGNTYRDVRRLDDRTVNGQEGWVLESHGKKKHGGHQAFFYEFGAVPDGRSYVEIHFEFPQDTRRTRDAIESVLASVEWKS